MEKMAFVMPHFADNQQRYELLHRTAQSFLAQTDKDWIAVIVDDCSPLYSQGQGLGDIVSLDPDRIHVFRPLTSAGAGAARNKGVRYAASLGAKYILYHDDDDLAHPDKVRAIRQRFTSGIPADFVYSPVVAIDKNDLEIPRDRIRLDVLDIIEELERYTPQGNAVFVPMVTKTGFIACMSTVAVRVQTALEYPFPFGRASDDSHTWMRMAASGLNFVYCAETPTRYRILSRSNDETSIVERDRAFLREKVHNDIDGFEEGMAICFRRKIIRDADVFTITQKFLARLAKCLERQGDAELSRVVASYDTAHSLAQRLTLEKCYRDTAEVDGSGSSAHKDSKTASFAIR